MSVKIYNSDCLEQLQKIKEKVDLVLVDLPYGQTSCHWDSCINLKQMWTELKKICKTECVYIFFCTTKFGYDLIESNKQWFRYDLVWEKSNSVGFLNANKMPMRKHEMIYIFSNNNNPKSNDLNNNRNLGLRAYSEQVFKYINKTYGTINKIMRNHCAEHFFRYKTSQFGLPTKNTYNLLIDNFKINKMIGFREYQDIKDEWNTPPAKLKSTYNSQKTKGKSYKVKAHKIKKKDVYGQSIILAHTNNGTRHPNSILCFNNPKKYLHRTQKPVDLSEFLIKSYSNKNELVLDFTMGSGTTGIACLNTCRRFIGIEKDTDIFKTAKHRLFKHELERYLNKCR